MSSDTKFPKIKEWVYHTSFRKKSKIVWLERSPKNSKELGAKYCRKTTRACSEDINSGAIGEQPKTIPHILIDESRIPTKTVPRRITILLGDSRSPFNYVWASRSNKFSFPVSVTRKLSWYFYKCSWNNVKSVPERKPIWKNGNNLRWLLDMYSYWSCWLYTSKAFLRK